MTLEKENRGKTELASGTHVIGKYIFDRGYLKALSINDMHP